MVSAGVLVTAIGAAGTGAMIPLLVSNANALSIAGTGGAVLAVAVGAGLIQRGRAARRPDAAVVSAEPEPEPEPETETETTPLGRPARYPAEFVVGELLVPPPSSAPVAHPFAFAPPFPPPPAGARAQQSPLPALVPDDASALADLPAPAVESAVLETEPAVVEMLVVDEPVVDEAVAVDEPVAVEETVAALPIAEEPLVDVPGIVEEPVVDAEILEPLLPEPAATVQNALAASPLVPDSVRAMASLSTVLHDTGNQVLDQYRRWVLDQALGDSEFHTLDIDAHHRDLFMLSSCGVATLLSWLHEQHRATYTVDTWIDEILPSQGIEIDDRELAIELLIAAALYAGGIHTSPTARLREYRSDELVTAMATMHVGLLRLYCGIGHRHPAAIVGHQFDGTPFAN
jgi:hypothetical protein